MERFTVTRVSNNDVQPDHVKKFRTEIAINVNELNKRKNSRTVPNIGERRKFSLAQLTRYSRSIFLAYFN